MPFSVPNCPVKCRLMVLKLTMVTIFFSSSKTWLIQITKKCVNGKNTKYATQYREFFTFWPPSHGSASTHGCVVARFPKVCSLTPDTSETANSTLPQSRLPPPGLAERLERYKQISSTDDDFLHNDLSPRGSMIPRQPEIPIPPWTTTTLVQQTPRAPPTPLIPGRGAWVRDSQGRQHYFTPGQISTMAQQLALEESTT